jgi:hypothetical protein
MAKTHSKSKLKLQFEGHTTFKRKCEYNNFSIKAKQYGSSLQQKSNNCMKHSPNQFE